MNVAMTNAVLRPMLRRWLVIVAVELIALGLVSLIRPEWYRSTAYDFARDLIPLEGWGVIFAVMAAMMVAALWYGAEAHHFVRFTLALHGVAQIVWGSSIFALTLSGSFGAFGGALQWWLVGGVSLTFAGSSLTVHREVGKRGA